MRVSAPAIRWPTELATAGPAQDPMIVLAGRAEIDGVGFRVTALRMREGMRLPDYRAGVPEGAYEDALERMVDDIEDLVDSLGPQRVVINDAHYLLWMVPDPAHEPATRR